MVPGTKLLVTGITLCILGLLVITLVIPVLLFDLINDSNGEQFKAPGRTQVMVEEPGRYYLWNNYHTIFEGKSYNRSKRIPDGMEFKISNQETNKPFDFVPQLSISSNRGMKSSNSIGYVDITTPQNIEIEILGGAEERIFSFSRSVFSTQLGLIIGGALLTMLICSAGFALSIWGMVKRVNSKKYDDQANIDKP